MGLGKGYGYKVCYDCMGTVRLPRLVHVPEQLRLLQLQDR